MQKGFTECVLPRIQPLNGWHGRPRRRILVVLQIAFQLVLFCSAARADTAIIHGRILDPQGAGVAGARLKLLNAAGSKIGETVSDAEGAFQFAAIEPGVYQITAESPAFVRVLA